MVDELSNGLAWWWSRFGVGEPRFFAEPLSYEPRAIWQCRDCGRLLVGTKNGDLHRLDSRPAGGDSGGRKLALVFAAQDGIVTEGTRSVVGCLGDGPCGATGALVGDGGGRLVHLSAGGAVRSEALQLDGARIRSLALVTGGAEPVYLCLTTRRTVALVQYSAGALRVSSQIQLDQPGRWLVRRSTSELEHWYVVTTTGSLGELTLTWNGRHGVGLTHWYRRGDPGAPVSLVAVPRTLAASRDEAGTLTGLLYGMSDGLRFLRVDDGSDELILACGPVHFVRCTQIFGEFRVLVCGRDGAVWSTAWRGGLPAASHRAPRWFEWPRLPSEVMNIVIEPAGRDQEFTHATAFLRDHQVVSLRIWNRPRLRETVDAARRAGSLADPSVALGFVDAESFAPLADRVLQAALARAEGVPGRPDVPDAVLDACERLGRTGALAPTVLLRTTMATLAVAGSSGPARTMAVATRLVDILCRHLAQVQTMSPDWDRVVDLIGFIRKHYHEAHTFSQKRRQLGLLERVNRGRPTPDAFIYAARLRTQGYDLLDERALAGPAWAVATRDGMAVVSGADGSISTFAVSGDRLGPPRTLRPAEDVGGGFRDYSRVLLAASDEAAWVVFPKRLRAGECHRELRLPQRELQVYSAVELPHEPGSFLLGLRGEPAPLAIQRAGGRVRPLRSVGPPTAFAARDVGRRRVWVVAAFRDGDIASGGQDAHLSVGRLHDDTVEWYGAPRQLGGTIRAAQRFDVVGRDGPFEALVVGTEAGEIFCFRKRSRDRQPMLELRFRDILEGRVMRVFEGTVRGVHCALVLEDSGRITAYCLGPLADRNDFFGRRIAQFTLGPGASAAASVAPDRLVVAGWDARTSTATLRLVQVVGESKLHLEEALDSFKSKYGIERPLALAVMAGFPMAEGSVRAALVEHRALGSVGGQSLGDLRDGALTAYPDDRSEMKAVIGLIRDRLNAAETEAEALHLFRLIGHPDLRQVLRGHPKLRSAIWHKLLTPRFLELLPPDAVERWIEEGLHDETTLVRVETLQALCECLHVILRRGGRDTAFRVSGQAPAIAGAMWLVDLLARYLYANPPRVADPAECELGAWMAMMAIAKLIRLFPEATYVVLDHLSVSGVDTDVLHLLRRTLESERDQVPGGIAEKVASYFPAWAGGRPSIQTVLDYLRRNGVPDKRAGEDSPDSDFQAARAACYAVFRKMAEFDHLPPHPDDPPSRFSLHPGKKAGPVRWLRPRLDKDRRAQETAPFFMEFTHRWLVELYNWFAVGQTARETASFETTLRRLIDQEPQPVDDRETLQLRYLFEPERTIARTIFGHWLDLLLQPLPRVGDSYDDWLLTRAMKGGYAWTFHCRQAAGQEGVMRVRRVNSQTERDHVERCWKTVAELRHPGIPAIRRVLCKGNLVAMAMEEVPGPALYTSWEARINLPHAARAAMVEHLYRDIGGALGKLHERRVLHLDVAAHNILHHASTADAEGRYVLIDFGDSSIADDRPDREDGWSATVRSARAAYPDLPAMSGVQLPSGALGYYGDWMALFDLLAHLGCGKRLSKPKETSREWFVTEGAHPDLLRSPLWTSLYEVFRSPPTERNFWTQSSPLESRPRLPAGSRRQAFVDGVSQAFTTKELTDLARDLDFPIRDLPILGTSGELVIHLLDWYVRRDEVGVFVNAIRRARPRLSVPSPSPT